MVVNRNLDTFTLDNAAKDYAVNFMQPSIKGVTRYIQGREWVLESLYNATFKDEHEYVVTMMLEEWLSKNAKSEFEAEIKKSFTKRDNKVFHKLLEEHLAISPSGDHIEGKIGKVEVGRRVVRREPLLIRRPIVRPAKPGYLGGEWRIIGYEEAVTVRRVEWPVYAGEGIERAEGRVKKKVGDPGPGADPLPDTAEPLPVGANVTNISAESAIAAVDAVADKLDEGSTAAEIRGRTGSQPNDPDASETGTLLFTLPMSDPAFNAGVDDTDGTVSATADTITDDSSADSTGTLGYCRAAATGTGADDHIDMNATTDGSGASDWNTLSIVSGSTVSMTSMTLGLSQGSTAS